MHSAARLLARFQSDSLYAELDGWQRRHELPYTVTVEGVPQRGVVDLIARPSAAAHWRLYDFKTDELKENDDLAAYLVKMGYDRQVNHYAAALAGFLDHVPQAFLVFLNVGGRVRTVAL